MVRTPPVRSHVTFSPHVPDEAKSVAVVAMKARIRVSSFFILIEIVKVNING
jgi:hypothetical protein